MHGTLRFLYLSQLLNGICMKIFIMNWYISKSYTTSKNTIEQQYTYIYLIFESNWAWSLAWGRLWTTDQSVVRERSWEFSRFKEENRIRIIYPFKEPFQKLFHYLFYGASIFAFSIYCQQGLVYPICCIWLYWAFILLACTIR